MTTSAVARHQLFSAFPRSCAVAIVQEWARQGQVNWAPTLTVTPSRARLAWALTPSSALIPRRPTPPRECFCPRPPLLVSAGLATGLQEGFPAISGRFGWHARWHLGFQVPCGQDDPADIADALSCEPGRLNFITYVHSCTPHHMTVTKRQLWQPYRRQL